MEELLLQVEDVSRGRVADPNARTILNEAETQLAILRRQFNRFEEAIDTAQRAFLTGDWVK